jgi:predicted esterase
MTVHTIEAVKTARYVVLGAPDGPAQEVWVACHGYGQLATRFARHLRPAERAGRLIAVPEALSRFYLDGAERRYERVGASWMTREAREADIADTVRYLDDVFVAVCARAGADPRAVPLGVLGFSQGTATASRWLHRSLLLRARPRRVQRLVLWGGGLPPDLDPAAERAWLDDAALTFVAGEADEVVPPARVGEQVAAVRAAGVAAALRTYDGGHRLQPDLVREVMAAL